MRVSRKILQYYLDNDIRRVLKKHSSSLNEAQKTQLQASLDLHYSLQRLQVKKAFGEDVLRRTLQEIQDEKMRYSTDARSTYRLIVAGVAMLVVVFVVVGLNIPQAPTHNELSVSNVRPDGTIKNLQNLNQVDIKNDISLVEAIAPVSETEFDSVPNIEEVVDENF